MPDRIQVFHNKAGKNLAKNICDRLSIDPGKLGRKEFADGEIFLQIEEEVRDNNVFIVAPTNPPAENFLEAMLLVDAIKRASAKKITLVLPYLGYNRQDRKDRPRVPLSSKVLIRSLGFGINRVLLLDIHSEATAGFFSDEVNVDHIYGSKIIVPLLKDVLGDTEFVVASPDKGGGPRAEKFADLLGQADHVLFSKSRVEHNKVSGVKVIGDVSGKLVVFVDDIIDTGGTMVADAKAAIEAGATDVYAVATHAPLSGRAVTNIDKSPISKLIVTDTINTTEEKVQQFKNTEVHLLSAAPLLANAIQRIHEGRSVSELIL